MRDECQRLETELARLRPELEKVYALVTPDGCDLMGGIFETARAVTELRAERDQLRAEVELDEALQLATERSLKTAIARADRAEADLATERARLDSGQILLTVAGERAWHSGVDLRAAIDAAIKEDAK
jgi:multidrug efflux pump subunit AcrA (membrane-fusion protein)